MREILVILYFIINYWRVLHKLFTSSTCELSDKSFVNLSPILFAFDLLSKLSAESGVRPRGVDRERTKETATKRGPQGGDQGL